MSLKKAAALLLVIILMISNKVMVSHAGTGSQMPSISFEQNENLDFMSVYHGATTQFTTQGVIGGTRALLVNTGTLDTNYGGIRFDMNEPFNWGDNAVFKAYLTNPNHEDIQIRIDVKDTSNNRRINYFTLSANSSRSITIDNLGPQTPDFSGADGWWGADNGIDQANIDLFEIYLWEESPGLSATSFIVDHITTQAEITPIVTLDKTTATIDKEIGTALQLTATVMPDAITDKTVTWSSSNISVATVDQSGQVTAKGNGHVTITATSNEDHTKKATCAVTVIGFAETIIPYMNRLSFEDQETSATLVENNSTTNRVSNNGITHGSKALDVLFNTGSSSIDFVPVDDKPWVISSNACLTFSAKSQVSSPFDLYVTVGLIDPETGTTNQQVNKISIVPNEQMKITTAYNISQGDLAIRSFSDMNGSGVTATSLVSGPGNIGGYHITKITFGVNQASAGRHFILDSVKTVDDATRVKLGNYYYLDRYGQSNYIDYDEKIHHDQELLDAEANEQIQLDTWIAELEANASRNQFGGWRNEALKQASTGRFYVKKVEGQWMMIDPEGYPYLSTGLDVIRYGDQNTWVAGREPMFENLPDRNGQFSEHFSNLSGCPVSPDGSNETNLGINFYTINLEKKYGDDWLEKWKSNAIKRTKAWGFTSLGCWSLPSLAFGKGNQVKTPYAANFWVTGTHAKLSLDGPGWGHLSDPFDPQFEHDVYNGAMALRDAGVDRDPWCIGVFVDNEIHWGRQEGKYLVWSTFVHSDAYTSPAYTKRALIDWLKEKYNNDINNLNTAWGASLNSFDDFLPSYTGPVGVQDTTEMFEYIAEKYYKTVHDICERVLPNTMYLGSRFADWGCPQGIAAIAAKYCDIVSYNSYKTHPIQNWMELDTFDKPIMIGEFHMNTCERGAITRGLVPVWPQDRERMVADYLDDIEDNNKLVGIHWFQYFDEPILGRGWDGENSDTGFVDVTDQPYPSLVNAARSVHSTMYENKFAGSQVIINPKPQVDPVFPDKESEEPEPLPPIPVIVVPEFAGLTFEGNDTSVYRLSNATASSAQVVTGTGVTQGSKALKYTVSNLNKSGNGVYSNLILASPGVFGLNMSDGISYDVTNPGSVPVQLRINIHSNGAIATYYYTVEPGETRHIDMVEAGPCAMDVSNPRQGYWGLDNGIFYNSMNGVSFYIWEDSPGLINETSAALIFDNIQAIKN